ncbi:MAG TPA: pilus assembly protein N-terminal domain-containing protein [Gemmatimonadaceae bacterium]|nr:pilus assembly protein N-terminal domain-containing protein [Gemmatimonadaceae bacterium]
MHRARPRGLHVRLFAALLVATLGPAALRAQTPDAEIIRVDLPVGRSYPIEMLVTINRVSVASPDIADVAVVGERDVVINARAAGETDVILWGAGVPRRHYRVRVHSPSDRMQVILAVKFAEVRRDLLYNVGVSALYRNSGGDRVGMGLLRSDNAIVDDKILIPGDASFLTILSDFGTKDFLALIEAEQTRGNARVLAEPNLMAANKEQASFLAGGEIPIPVVQGGSSGPGGGTNVTIEYKEFGVRLNFTPEIVSDSLIKLHVAPEVSNLDFANAVILSGFRIPALRSRKLNTVVDVKRSQSLVISGLFNTEREKVRTGIPFLSDIPFLGVLFGSTRWQNNESELVVIVTPIVVDPMRPRAQDVLRLLPDTTLPARESLAPRIPERPAPRRP